jgi:hypothetical protein
LRPAPPRLVLSEAATLPLRPAARFNPHSGRRGHGLVQPIFSAPSRLCRPDLLSTTSSRDAALKMLSIKIDLAADDVTHSAFGAALVIDLQAGHAEFSQSSA